MTASCHTPKRPNAAEKPRPKAPKYKIDAKKSHEPKRDRSGLSPETRRLLKLLSREGAYLAALADGPAKAFCPATDGAQAVATMSRATLRACLAADWVEATPAASPEDGEAPLIRRYRVTEAGRKAVARSGAAGDPLQDQHRAYGAVEAPTERTSASGRAVATRVETRRANLRETPILWLSRRRGPDGAPFLSPIEVDAAERLRADYEAASIGPQVAQNWNRFLAAVDEGGRGPTQPGLDGAPAARVRAATAALGPGLADVALRVCCLMEGLETAERALGWSSRSGKVVLKIALQRLVEHYGLAVEGPAKTKILAWRDA